jgi:predicted amidophosphoribosyltransferase
MASIRDVALPLATMCTVVTPVGDGICDRCHRPPSPGFTRCWSCAQVESQLSEPCELIVPISLYAVGYQLHFQLRHYKDHEGEMAHDFLVRTAALLGYFLQLHEGCIATVAGGGWDLITSVPSSIEREGEHPLVTAINMVQSLRDTYEPLLGRGTADVGHNVASDDAYEPVRELNGERVLLIDDTFTSGARAQSAASALNKAGAVVVALVPIGRVITPGWSPQTKEYWERQLRLDFDFDVCCVGAHGPTSGDT